LSYNKLFYLSPQSKKFDNTKKINVLDEGADGEARGRRQRRTPRWIIAAIRGGRHPCGVGPKAQEGKGAR